MYTSISYIISCLHLLLTLIYKYIGYLHIKKHIVEEFIYLYLYIYIHIFIFSTDIYIYIYIYIYIT